MVMIIETGERSKDTVSSTENLLCKVSRKFDISGGFDSISESPDYLGAPKIELTPPPPPPW